MRKRRYRKIKGKRQLVETRQEERERERERREKDLRQEFRDRCSRLERNAA